MGKSVIFGLVLLGVILVSSASSLHKPELALEKCGMEQYECNCVTTFDEGSDPGVQKSRYYFDSIRKRMRLVNTKIDIEGKELKSDFYFTPENIYFFYPRERTCWKVDVAVRIDACSPKDAVLTGERKMGSEKAPLTARVINYRAGDIYHEKVVDYRGKAYIVMLEIVFGTTNGEPTMRTEQFYNHTEGISDASVFDLPTACKFALTTEDEHLIQKITDQIPSQ